MHKLFTAIALIFTAMLGHADPISLEISGNKLIVFCADDSVKTGKAVLILPGGGYTHLAVNHEGLDWGEWFAARGVTAAVFAYPMPEGNNALPSGAVYEAITAIKANADKWNFSADSLGIMGSSAGGHLASTVATHAPDTLRPAFQILFYPVITMENGVTHSGSRKHLLGENPSDELVTLYSNELQVDELTPRAFMALSNDDKAVPPANSVRYYSALNRAGKNASLHIYPSGGHGWGFRPNFKYHDVMINELDAWLKSF